MTNEIDRSPSTVKGEPRFTMVRMEPADARLPVGQLVPLTNDLIQLPTNGETDGRALSSMESISEKSTPEQRARAMTIKLMAGMGVSAFVVIVLALTGLDVVTLAVIEVIGCLASFALALWLDQRDSPLATERFKAGQYTKIRQAELASQERMFARRMDTLERIVGGVLYAHSRKNSQHE